MTIGAYSNLGNRRRQIPIDDLTTAGLADTDWLLETADEASKFLGSFTWCRRVGGGVLDRHEPGIFALFCFDIEPETKEVDSSVWIMVGDIPPAYLDTLSNANGAEAIRSYVDAMRDWVDAASTGQPTGQLIPVLYKKSTRPIDATPENAQMLRGRIDFIEREILPQYADELGP
jgi:hypothetical protein